MRTYPYATKEDMIELARLSDEHKNEGAKKNHRK